MMTMHDGMRPTTNPSYIHTFKGCCTLLVLPIQYLLVLQSKE